MTHRWLHQRGIASFALVLGFVAASPAHAWDPATTHTDVTVAAAVRSGVHAAWMDASAGELGLYSTLRVDPHQLEPAFRGRLVRAIESADARAGARPRGGPGACPPPNSPPETSRNCVDGDAWSHSAIGWLRLGVSAESMPATRLLHHFSPSDPEAPQWRDARVSRRAARRIHSRFNGGSAAGFFTRKGSGNGGDSASAWYRSYDPLAPAAMHRHLRLAALAPSPETRDHNLAMAMLCLGALLHVAQDQAVPAHARADLQAFFSPLSSTPADDGLQLSETAKRYVLRPVQGSTEHSETDPPPPSVGLFGDKGLARWTATHFLSPGGFTPRRVPRDASASEAAAALLADQGLDDQLVAGATLAPWPSPDGYVRTAEGRPLAAFRRVDNKHLVLFSDRIVELENTAQLVPRSLEASIDLIRWIWGDPKHIAEQDGRVQVELGALTEARLHAIREDGEGVREVLQSIELRAEQPGERVTVEGVQGEATHLVLEGMTEDGDPRLVEVRRAAAPTGTP